MNIEITAIIPNYNHGKFLKRSIGALLNQEFELSEIIIIDDASTDDSLTIIRELMKKNQRISLIQNKKNLGVVKSLNKGFKNVKTKYVYFGSADDETKSNLFLELAGSLKKFPQARFACARAALYDKRGAQIGARPFLSVSKISRYFSPSETQELLKNGDNLFLSAVSLIRLGTQDRGEWFEESYGPYCDAQKLRLLALEGGFAFVPKILGIWHLLDGSYSKKLTLIPKSTIEVIERVIQDCGRYDFVPRWYPLLLKRRFIFSWLRSLCISSPKAFQKFMVKGNLPIPYPLTLMLRLFFKLPERLCELFVLASLTLYFKPFNLVWVFKSALTSSDD